MVEAAKPKKQVQRKPSSIKRTKQSHKRHQHNLALKSRLKNQIKSLRLVLAAKNKEEAKKLLAPTLSLITKMGSKGILHPNSVARYQSRLQRQFNTL